MSYALKLVILAAGALALHLVLGWAWTLAAGIAAGLWVGRGGWLLGAASVGLEWLVLIAYNFLVDARAVRLMTEAVGSILGNLPFWMIVALTLFIAVLLGALGGAVGTQLHHLIRSRKTALHHE